MEKMQSVDLSYWLPGDILQKADKMSMAHSLEVRVPFLDKEVFNFAAKLPKEAKIAAGTTKYIFRKAVSEFLPQETDERKKLGFPIPIRVWLRQNDWYQMVTDLFTSKEAEEFFHTEKLLQLLNDHTLLVVSPFKVPFSFKNSFFASSNISSRLLSGIEMICL